MKIYIAAPWTHKHRLPEIATHVTSLGYTITHDWWNHEAGDEDHQTLQRLAMLDFNAVVTCQVFVVLNFEKSEGKSVETGVALAMGKACIGVGPRYSNIFHNLSCWDWADDLDALYVKLRLKAALLRTSSR